MANVLLPSSPWHGKEWAGRAMKGTARTFTYRSGDLFENISTYSPSSYWKNIRNKVPLDKFPFKEDPEAYASNLEYLLVLRQLDLSSG